MHPSHPDLSFHNFEQSFGTPHFSKLTVVFLTNVPFHLSSFEQFEYFSELYADIFAPLCFKKTLPWSNCDHVHVDV